MPAHHRSFWVFNDPLGSHWRWSTASAMAASTRVSASVLTVISRTGAARSRPVDTSRRAASMRTSTSGSDNARATCARRRLREALRQTIAPATATTPATTSARDEGSSGTKGLLEEFPGAGKLDEDEDHEPAEERD